MKFKEHRDIKRLTVKCSEYDGDALIVETREDGHPGLYVSASGVFLSRKKAIKLALAILDELEPLHTWRS